MGVVSVRRPARAVLTRPFCESCPSHRTHTVYFLGDPPSPSCRTWDNETDCGEAHYELTDSQGGLYGPKVQNSSCFSGDSCPTTPLFNDYFVAKVKEVVDQYHPDVLYFDSKQSILTEGARLDYLSHYYNSAAEWMKNGSSAGVVCTFKGSDLANGAGVLDFERGGIDYIRTEQVRSCPIWHCLIIVLVLCVTWAPRRWTD